MFWIVVVMMMILRSLMTVTMTASARFRVFHVGVQVGCFNSTKARFFGCSVSPFFVKTRCQPIVVLRAAVIVKTKLILFLLRLGRVILRVMIVLILKGSRNTGAIKQDHVRSIFADDSQTKCIALALAVVVVAAVGFAIGRSR